MKDVLDTLKKAIEEGQAKDASKAVQAALDAGAEPGAILRDVMRFERPSGGTLVLHTPGGRAIRARRGE